MQVNVASARRNGAAWHPDGGSLLAVSGTENDVTMIERLSWSVAFSLKGPHTAAVNVLSFSPNGTMAFKSETQLVIQVCFGQSGANVTAADCCCIGSITLTHLLVKAECMHFAFAFELGCNSIGHTSEHQLASAFK